MFRWWAFWRRVQYGAGFLTLVMLVLTGVYYAYWYMPPNCFDQVHNGDERGMDCGGNCVRICAFDVEPLRVVWAESFKIIDGQYNAVAYIENKNALIGTPRLPYVFRLYDDTGLITEREGATTLPINGVYPLFEGKIITGTRVPTRTEILFANDAAVWLPGKAGSEQFGLIKRELLSTDSKPRLIAQMENKSLDEAQDVEIVATIFDSKKKPLTVSRTVVEYFKGRTTQEVVFTWPEPIAKTLRSCEVPTDVILAIDLSGSMNDDGGTPPEPISSVLNAAEAFVKRLKPKDKVGLVTYATGGSLVEPLVNDSARIAQVVAGLTIAPPEERGSTNTGEAIARIREEIASERHNQNARKVAIILSDGLATAPGTVPEAEKYALDEMKKLKEDADIQIFTIGLGAKVNETFLRQIASTPESYFLAPSIKELDSIYTQITAAICEDGAAVIDIIPKVESNFPVLQ
jgi:Mg-chelatase subunit ChlD